MKTFKSILILVIVTFALVACSPTPMALEPTAAKNDFLEAATYVMMIFSTMAGIPLLIAATVNLLKILLVGISWVVNLFFRGDVNLTIDGYSDQIASVLTIIAFGALVYFRVFQSLTSFDWLDGQAKQIAELLNYVAVLFGQLFLKKTAYGILRGQIPLLGYSYSK